MDDDLTHYMKATGRLASRVRLLRRAYQDLHRDRAFFRQHLQDADIEIERLREAVHDLDLTNSALMGQSERLAEDRRERNAEIERLRAVLERAIRRVEQEQFRGNGTDALTELYRILCDESVAREPEAT
jgi:DNA-binding transcriptional MerR regulator